MTIVDTLDVIPAAHPDRGQLIAILRDLVEGIAHYQDPQTGLWYQILDQPKLDGNWTETSSSSMFTYIIDIAIKRGYISSHYKPVARKGYQGVLLRESHLSNCLHCRLFGKFALLRPISRTPHC